MNYPVDPVELEEIHVDFHRFELKVEDTDPPHRYTRVFVPVINGSDLRELVRPVEIQQSTRTLAEAHGGLHRGVHWPLKKHYLGRGYAVKGRTVVLGCACGISGCWPWDVQISVGPEEVRWEGFRLPVRESSFEARGGFRIERWKYEAELDRVVESLVRSVGPLR